MLSVKSTWWLGVCTNWDRSCGWFPGSKKHLGTRLATRLTSTVWRKNQRKDMMRYVEYYMLKCMILANQKHWSWIVTCIWKPYPLKCPCKKVASLICDGNQSQVKYWTCHSLGRPDFDERVDSNSVGRILYEDVQGWWWCGCHKL